MANFMKRTWKPWGHTQGQGEKWGGEVSTSNHDPVKQNNK